MTASEWPDVIDRVERIHETKGIVLYKVYSHSLLCVAYKIVTKVQGYKIVYETDVFQFDSKFADKMMSIRVCISMYLLISPFFFFLFIV